MTNTTRAIALACFIVIGGCNDGGFARRTAASADTAGCVVNATPVVKLTGDEVNAGILRLSDDHIYVENEAQIVVFDTKGRFLRRLGRKGSGPGEFRRIQDVIVLEGGRLAVFEHNPPRLTVLDSLGRALYTSLLPVGIDRGGALMLDDSTFVLSGDMVDTRPGPGIPLVHIRADGSVLEYVGMDEAEKTGNLKGIMLPRLVASHPTLGLVTLPRMRYDIEKWIGDPPHKQTYSRQVEWFRWPMPLNRENPHAAGPPENSFRGLDIDEAGNAWVVAQTTAPDWEAAVENGRVVDREAWADVRIEVLDLEREQVLCSVPFEPSYVLTGFAKPRHIASYKEDDSGEPTITVWRLEMSDVRR